jgi:hypothetical protein
MPNRRFAPASVNSPSTTTVAIAGANMKATAINNHDGEYDFPPAAK